MTGRHRNNKIETIIENSRSEGKWKRVIELAEELKQNSNFEPLANFLIGEGKLETYLEENPPIEANFQRAKLGLIESKQALNAVTGEEGQKAGIALDAHLLLAKIFYACGQYDDSLEHFVKAELNSLSEKELTLRSLRILAESYAIKGMCLENQGPKGTSRFKMAERETEMITCFERAADVGLLYLQDLDGSDSNHKMGAILETALQRAPIVLIKAGKLQEALDRYRTMLKAVETKATQSLRLTLARQLAEVLLRGVSGTIYHPPTTGSSSLNSNQSRRIWKPRTYSQRNHFIPENEHEETILLLLISEALAVRDTVLSQSPEFREQRLHALGNATAVYDLMTLATIRWGQIGLLHQSYEKALKFSFNEHHVWRQYAFCLVSIGQHIHAVRALKEAALLMPSDPIFNLMAARVYYEELGMIKEGVHCAEEALKKVESKGPENKPNRAQLYVGIGLQQIAYSSMLKSDREKYGRLSLEALEKAAQSDPNDHLAEYYLAMQHALNFSITEALVHIRIALSLRAEHANSLHLFALLLTASKRSKEALDVVEDAVLEFPDNFHLLHLKAHLELHLHDADTALETVQLMLAKWKEIYETQTNSSSASQERDAMTTATEHERHSDTRSVLQMHSSQLSDRDSNSIHAASIAASRMEQALSEAASSLSSFSPRPGPQKAWLVQLRIWLLLADIYLAMEQPNEAMNCVFEASLINPLSHQIMFMRGQIHLFLGQFTEAKQHFINAVSANPHHSEALRALGQTHHLLGEPRLAEKHLKDAVKVNPKCPQTWNTLGEVLETLGDLSASAECLATALQLEPQSPVLPFTSISLTFE